MELRDDQARRNGFNDLTWDFGRCVLVAVYLRVWGGGPDEIYRRKSRVKTIQDTAVRISLTEWFAF